MYFCTGIYICATHMFKNMFTVFRYIYHVYLHFLLQVLMLYPQGKLHHGLNTNMSFLLTSKVLQSISTIRLFRFHLLDFF